MQKKNLDEQREIFFHKFTCKAETSWKSPEIRKYIKTISCLNYSVVFRLKFEKPFNVLSTRYDVYINKTHGQNNVKNIIIIIIQ